MKKLVYLGLSLILLFTFCEKEAAETDSNSPVTVKYEITWPGITQYAYGNSITYVDSAGKFKIDTALSGTADGWSKTVTMDASHTKELILVSNLYTSQSGTTSARIYINGEMKAENQDSPLSISGGYIFLYFNTAISSF